MELARKLDKEPIAVNEAPLFAVNRILVPMLNEAAFVLMEGIATAEDIDRGMMLGANHPIGPLALADLVGLDVLLAVMETIYRDRRFEIPALPPCPQTGPGWHFEENRPRLLHLQLITGGQRSEVRGWRITPTNY